MFLPHCAAAFPPGSLYGRPVFTEMAKSSENPSKIHVRIENPLPGWMAETNLRRARRLERAGRAVFVAPLVIRFVCAESQAEMARRAEERQRKARTACGYDGLRDNYFEHARHIPLIHPEKMLGART